MTISEELIKKCIKVKASFSRETIVKFLSQHLIGPNDTNKFIAEMCNAGYYFDKKDGMFKNIEKTRRLQ